MDNSKPIPEPILTNVREAADDYYAHIREHEHQTYQQLFMDGAQYGYNIAQVLVEDLKDLVDEGHAIFKIAAKNYQNDIEMLENKISELEKNINKNPSK